MVYDDTELRRRIQTAVLAALEHNPTTTGEIIDRLFVQLKPLVKQEQKAYTVAQLRELLTTLL